MAVFSFSPLAYSGEKIEPVSSRHWTPAHGPDPEGSWRIIAIDDDASTSNCIGETISPLCTIDTEIACGVRSFAEFCHRAYWFDTSHIRYDRKLSSKRYSTYRVLDVSTAPKDAVWPIPLDAPARLGAKKGDLLIKTIFKSCWGPLTPGNPEPSDCSPEYSPTTFALRQFGKRWLITDTYSPPH